VWNLGKLRLHGFAHVLWVPTLVRTDHPRLVRNAPHTWNVSPTYDRGRVSIRVGLSYNAANIAGYGDGTPGPLATITSTPTAVPVSIASDIGSVIGEPQRESTRGRDRRWG